MAPRKPRNPYGQFEWVRRRRLIYGTLGFCLTSAIAIQVAAHFGVDSTLLNTIAAANYTLAGATLTSYIFGAQQDDKSARECGADIPKPEGESQ